MYYVYLLKKYATNKIKALSTYYMIEIISEDTKNKNYFTEIASLPFDEDYTSFYGGVDGEPEPLLDNILGEFCYYISCNCEFHLAQNGEYINNDFSFIEFTNKHDTIIHPYAYTVKFYTWFLKIIYGNGNEENI